MGDHHIKKKLDNVKSEIESIKSAFIFQEPVSIVKKKIANKENMYYFEEYMNKKNLQQKIKALTKIFKVKRPEAELEKIKN